MSGIVFLFLFMFLMSCPVLCEETGACKNTLDKDAVLNVWKNSGLLIPIFGNNQFNE